MTLRATILGWPLLEGNTATVRPLTFKCVKQRFAKLCMCCTCRASKSKEMVCSTLSFGYPAGRPAISNCLAVSSHVGGGGGAGFESIR